jgi:hypothetical protein
MAENELEITEIRLQNGEAFVLVTYRVASSDTLPGEYTLPAGEGSLTAGNITVSGYILKVDLAEEKVTEFGQVDEITGLRHVNLEDVDFTKIALPESEEPDD